MHHRPAAAERILTEFGLTHEASHIINGYGSVRAVEGENPVKAGGKLIVIDGGFCRMYHKKTGIAGYTLVYNSRGLTLRTHQPLKALRKRFVMTKILKAAASLSILHTTVYSSRILMSAWRRRS